MGTNWNVRRETQTIPELEALVAEAKRDVEDAEWTRPGSRERMEASHILGSYQRRLDDLKAKAEKRKEDETRSPAEIVDRLMGS
jgi:hypothetical protein